MIDTDKYEGHTEGPWIPQVNSQVCSSTVVHTIIATVEYNHPQNKALIADAPLLLAEVKQLRKFTNKLNNIIGTFDEFMCGNWTRENLHRTFTGTKGLWNELLTKEDEE